MLLDDGRVAFIDFGFFKRMDRAAVELELAAQRAVVEGDAPALHALLAKSGFLPDPERVDPDNLLAFIADAIWWYTTADETVELTPEIATHVMIESSDPRSSHFREMRHPRHAPRAPVRPAHGDADARCALAVACARQLARIAREWIYGDEPVTELGKEEAEFYGRTGVGTAG